MDYRNCCRLCLKNTKVIINCLEVVGLCKKIEEVLGIKISQFDDYSTKICRDCSYEITNFAKYRENALNNQKTIEDYKNLELKLASVAAIKVEETDEDVIFVQDNTEDSTKVDSTTNSENFEINNTDSTELVKEKIQKCDNLSNESSKKDTIKNIKRKSNEKNDIPLKKVKVLLEPLNKADIQNLKSHNKEQKILVSVQKQKPFIETSNVNKVQLLDETRSNIKSTVNKDKNKISTVKSITGNKNRISTNKTTEKIKRRLTVESSENKISTEKPKEKHNKIFILKRVENKSATTNEENKSIIETPDDSTKLISSSHSSGLTANSSSFSNSQNNSVSLHTSNTSNLDLKINSLNPPVSVIDKNGTKSSDTPNSNQKIDSLNHPISKTDINDTKSSKTVNSNRKVNQLNHHVSVTDINSTKSSNALSSNKIRLLNVPVPTDINCRKSSNIPDSNRRTNLLNAPVPIDINCTKSPNTPDSNRRINLLNAPVPIDINCTKSPNTLDSNRRINLLNAPVPIDINCTKSPNTPDSNRRINLLNAPVPIDINCTKSPNTPDSNRRINLLNAPVPIDINCTKSPNTPDSNRRINLLNAPVPIDINCRKSPNTLNLNHKTNSTNPPIIDLDCLESIPTETDNNPINRLFQLRKPRTIILTTVGSSTPPCTFQKPYVTSSSMSHTNTTTSIHPTVSIYPSTFHNYSASIPLNKQQNIIPSHVKNKQSNNLDNLTIEGQTFVMKNSTLTQPHQNKIIMSRVPVNQNQNNIINNTILENDKLQKNFNQDNKIKPISSNILSQKISANTTNINSAATTTTTNTGHSVDNHNFKILTVNELNSRFNTSLQPNDQYKNQTIPNSTNKGNKTCVKTHTKLPISITVLKQRDNMLHIKLSNSLVSEINPNDLGYQERFALKKSLTQTINKVQLMKETHQLVLDDYSQNVLKILGIDNLK